MVASWKHVPILLTFKHSVESGTIANIKSVILVALIMYGGLTNEEIAEWVVCLGLDWCLPVSRGLIWSNCFNEDLISTLPHWNSLYGISNKPYNAKFVFHVLNWRISFNHFIGISLDPQNATLSSQNLMKLWK